jgi:Aspartyl/Asparaginyl beta-hydroxylase
MKNAKLPLRQVDSLSLSPSMSSSEEKKRRQRHLHRWNAPSFVVELHESADADAGASSGQGRDPRPSGGGDAVAGALCRCSSVQTLEASLQSMLGNNNAAQSSDEDPPQARTHNRSEQPDLYVPPRHEIAWLSCRRRRKSERRNQPKEETPPSITGLVEDLEDDSNEEDPSSSHDRSSRAVSFRHWKLVASAAPVESDSSSDSSPDSAMMGGRGQGRPPRPAADWSRKERQQHDYVPPSRPKSNPEAPWLVDVVDLLPMAVESSSLPSSQKPKAADAYHFLRCLLSPSNAHSPWTRTETGGSAGTDAAAAADGGDDGNDGNDDDFFLGSCDVVLLLLPSTWPFASVLQEFRLADACPSWYLHSVATLSTNSNPKTAAAAATRCLVYRRLPPRVALSSVHWETLEPVPVPGCLWEWHYLPTKSDGDNNNEKDKTNGAKGSSSRGDGVGNDDNDADGQEEPKHIVRLVGPPFFDALAEYPELQIVLDHLGDIREEAQTISQWTAWPEEQHYSAGTDDDDDDDSGANDNGDGSATKSVPWTVFPLCYCFPADDESKRAWVPVMSRAVPRTTTLLQRPELRRLRTALFSRLAPGARLFAHTGWSDLANHVLRVHVPVLLPPASTVHSRPERSLCGLWVDGVVQTLAPNELVCFDDSKMHWAFNYDAEERVVLILDFERPADVPPGTATGGHTEELDRFILQAQGLPH